MSTEAPTTPDPADATPRRVPALVDALALAAIAAAMLVWTWGKWADVLVDFGGELYVPWRLAAGEVLYRDLAYFTGPLSPYLNAGVFALFGAGIGTLVAANLAWVAALTALLWTWLRSLGGRLAATTGCALFLTTFAFAHLAGYGNYCFVAPYSHETLHGSTLSIAALLLAGRWLAGGATRAAALAGLVFGLVFLTKAEIVLALAVGVGTIGAGAGLARLHPWGRIGASGLAFVGAALVPAVVATLALALAMPLGDAIDGTLGAWGHLGQGEVTSFPLYRMQLGTLPLDHNLGELASWSGRWALALGAPLVLAIAWRRPAGAAGGAAEIAAGVAVAGLALAPGLAGIAWMEAARPLPVAMALLAAWLLVRLVRGSDREPAGVRRDVLRLGAAAFALAMLARMILNARLQHYGYTLAMPATLVLAGALVGWIPAALGRAGRSAAVLRSAALAVLAVALVGHLDVTASNLKWKTVRVEAGGDALWADPRGEFVARAIRAVEERLPADGTLTVLPEGGMINFLTRRPASVRYFNFMPPELAMFGEDAIVAALEESPPDVILLVHRDTSEYGLPFFGSDYGRAVARWVRANYRQVELIGQEPLRPGTRFGVRVLAKKP